MAMAATALKDMLSISIKPRHDPHTDQYNRIFMVKFSLICSVIMGLSWYTDSISCIIPDSHGINVGFVSATCWIQGVYVYKSLYGRVDDVGYFGIPADIDLDGYLPNTPEHELCMTMQKKSNGEVHKNPACTPLEKSFYLQYQYMPFLVAALALFYFLPYMAFKTINSDLISLKDTVKGDEPDADKIAEHFFNNRSNPHRNNRFRVVFNIVIKILYLVANIVNFLVLDGVLQGEYKSYGTKWISWSKLENTIAHDYMGLRGHPKPGNVLLPPFGYCEVYSSAKDIKESVANKHKYVCEMSQNILYQYVLMVMWFAIVIGIVVSVIGIIILLVHYCVGIFGLRAHGPTGKRLFKLLSFRELQYLEYMRSKNIALYGEVMDKLRDMKLGPMPPKDQEFPLRDSAPLYPEQDRYDSKKPGFDF